MGDFWLRMAKNHPSLLNEYRWIEEKVEKKNETRVLRHFFNATIKCF